MCLGSKEGEIETIRRLVTQVYPAGIVSVVSDTWDFWQVVTDFAAALKSEILARQPDPFGNAKVVFRPDSGDPLKILTGYFCTDVSSVEAVSYTHLDVYKRQTAIPTSAWPAPVASSPCASGRRPPRA